MATMIPDSIAQWRLPDGSIIRLEDWVDKPVFSTVEILTGATDRTIPAFTYTVGEEVSSTANLTTRRIATERDTNIQVGGTNSSSEEILVFAVRVEPYEFTNTTPANATTFGIAGRAGQPVPSMNNLANLHSILTLRLMVSQKAYIEEGLGYFNAGFGPYGGGVILGITAAAAGRSYANQGLPSDEAVRNYRMPHHIGGTEKYRVELNNYSGTTIAFQTEATSPSALTGCMYRLVIHLEGARKRPVA